jgi:hypothetical protein
MAAMTHRSTRENHGRLAGFPSGLAISVSVDVGTVRPRSKVPKGLPKYKWNLAAFR